MQVSRLLGGVCHALVVVGAMLGVAVLNAATANADGPITLKSQLGDVCLDAPTGSWLPPVVINPCNGTDFQRWNLNGDQLESVAFPGNCLTMPGDRWTVHLGPCVNTFAQHWNIQPNNQVTSGFDACLTVLGGPAPGTWVSTRFCGGGPDQAWDSV